MVSPEEKLLNIIKNKKTDRSGGPGLSQPSLSETKEKSDEPFFFRFTDNVYVYRFIKPLSYLTLAACTGWFVLTFTRYPSALIKRFNDRTQPIAGRSSLSAGSAPVPAAPEFDFSVFSKTVFRYSKLDKPSKVINTGDIKTLNELISYFNLVGIIEEEQPQAIVEDKRNRKLYYLSVGDYIDEIKVSYIDKNEVVLTYQDESVTLTL